MAVARKAKARAKTPDKEMRKVTVLLPADLVAEAMDASGENLTSTIEAGLQQVALKKVYERLAASKGTYRYPFDPSEFRD